MDGPPTSNAAFAELIGTAFRADQPLWELREVVKSLLAASYDRQVVIEDLTAFALELRAAGREADEDIVFDVLDFLTGWCSPHMKL